MNNDFAEYAGKTYISFPPFPALLMLPFVKLAGSPENFRDGQFVIWLAGIAPAALLLVLEKLRRTGRSPRTELQNVALSLLFAFGTVYFFTAVEGTVWYAAMVIGAALSALYTLWALDALRVSSRAGGGEETVAGEPGGPLRRAREMVRRVDWRALAIRYALFAAPIAVAFAVMAWMNFTRYGRPSPFPFDHQFLTVAWQARMLKWGMLSYHYLAKNLGIALTSLPWLPPRGGAALFEAPF